MKIVFTVVVTSNLKDWSGAWLTVYYGKSVFVCDAVDVVDM